ncbi:MAG TPA: hypothetical protein VM935_07510 [Chitinophagaceae bacterium]|nr:hypothetical protein [Chitinophagaceae bacterium]
MKLGDEILKKLNKKFEPSTMVSLPFRKYDMAFKTNEDGDPILVFLGKLREDGTIKGDRFARRLLKDKDGNLVKDHWDYKGKV